MRFALLLCIVACTKSEPAPATPTASPPVAASGCKRTRSVSVNECSGIERPPIQTTACDRCLADTDCTAEPGGICREVGDNMCAGPRRQECRYPSPACGNQVCPEPESKAPPSMSR